MQLKCKISDFAYDWKEQGSRNTWYMFMTQRKCLQVALITLYLNCNEIKKNRKTKHCWKSGFRRKPHLR